MSTVENIDHLSQLPPELLEDIFDRVQHSNTPLVDPLSRSLFPFQQKPLFESLYVRSYEDLETFCDYVKNRPQLAAYTREFGVSIVPHGRSRELDREIEDPQSPSNERVKELFKTLVQITDMAIAGTDRIARLVLESDVVATSFPNLGTLHLSSAFNSLRDPFHPDLYKCLQRYNELDTFRLSVLRTCTSIHPISDSKEQVQPLLPFLTKINEVTLVGPLSASPTSVKALIGAFAQLHAVSLYDSAATESLLYDFLDHLCDPAILLHLELERRAVYGPPPQGNMFDRVRRMPQLEGLILGGSVSSLSTSFYSSLRSIPNLRRLTFLEKTDVSLEKLRQLIYGPEKHELLRTVTLDNVAGKIGTRICDQGACWDDVGERWLPWSDWILPEWSEDFDVDDLEVFHLVALMGGVTVKGTAIGAMRVTTEWDREMEEAQTYGDDLSSESWEDEEEYESE
ncbi:uncharacterized protein JCM6883_001477 [Sporobolomyces salmoneus]|uniref:uncharacterized protein n=1 Tax=Sporobolomyces salmoneus TaxID=183962 RepID=UPI00317CF2D8